MRLHELFEFKTNGQKRIIEFNMNEFKNFCKKLGGTFRRATSTQGVCVFPETVNIDLVRVGYNPVNGHSIEIRGGGESVKLFAGKMVKVYAYGGFLKTAESVGLYSRVGGEIRGEEGLTRVKEIRVIQLDADYLSVDIY